jgi:hypothetical protein
LSSRLSGNPAAAFRHADPVADAIVAATAPPASSGGDGSEAVVVELKQVVRRHDEPPFASAGRPVTALDASDRAVELDLAEHGLDGDLALAEKTAPVRRGQHAAHEVIRGGALRSRNGLGGVTGWSRPGARSRHRS